MRMFDVHGIEIRAPREKVFEFLRHAGNLPQWAHAFTSPSMERWDAPHAYRAARQRDERVVPDSPVAHQGPGARDRQKFQSHVHHRALRHYWKIGD